MNSTLFPALLAGFLAFTGTALAADSGAILETPRFRYAIAADARNLAFVDRATGADYLRPGASPCASVRRDGREFAATSARLADGRLTLGFAGASVTATLRVGFQPGAVLLAVEALDGPPVDSLVFLDVPLSLEGRPTESFGACALSLNLTTRVDQLPALQSHLRAGAERKFGLVGAKVAIVAGPMGAMLPMLRETLAEASELPVCRVAGPWAHEIPFNHGSYLFNFGSLTETNLDDWIGMARSLAFTQIDNHGGGEFFRFGDFELNRKRWPDGWDGWRRIVDRLHDAGIGSIFHTYAFFIDKRARYVTPVPDPRLDAFRKFTLAADATADATELTVNESTAGLSTITGFFEHNSVTLHLGDELVTFAGFSREPPWRFTGVRRGALGTRAAAHSRGTVARQLKECFGLFVPDPESTLFEEIAAHHADIVNRCGFDGIYLDAIDGSSILRGADECWYWADKFVVEIQKRLSKPVGMEMSAMWHHFWQYRTRWQAWDYPQRGHRRFVDLHAATVHGGLLLPLHLGWWNFQTFDPPQIDPTFPDVLETVAARLVGWDAGISLTGAVDRDKLRSVPLIRRAVDTLRAGEQLRHGGGFDDAARRLLREPGRDFALVTNAAGQVRFQAVHREVHLATPAASGSLVWTATNPHGPQTLRFRLELLMSAASADATNGTTLFDPRDLAAGDAPHPSAKGVQLRINPAETFPGDVPAVALVATNANLVPRNAAWARIPRRFPAPRNLKAQQALGFWVEGDGRGAWLAVRLESPAHLAFGAVADRYLPIDFTGPRFVTLVETESERWSDFVWDDGKHPYNVYRETIDFGAVESATLFLQNLPPGAETRCRIGPIQALPMAPTTVKNPVLRVNGQPVDLGRELALSSGQWLECQGSPEVVVFGSRGQTEATPTATGPLPRLRSGPNEIAFTCDPVDGPSPRLRVTVFCRGEVL